MTEEKTTLSNLESLDPRIRGVAGAFLQDILAAFGSDVKSYALTGSCLTSDYVPGKSDINSVLVLTDMCPTHLDKLASLGKGHGKKGMRAPLVMTCEYIERSQDVFPIEFLDIRLLHKTIHGAELFADLAVNKSLLRLQCERDLKAKLLHLHQGYISCSGTAKCLRDLLGKAYPGFFPLFRAMLCLSQMKREPALLKDEVLKDMESAFAVSLDCLRDARALSHKNSFFVDRAAVKDIFDKVYRVTHDLSLTMDRIAS